MSGSNRRDDVVQTDDQVALPDVWAGIGDALSAAQDAIANEAYLGSRNRRCVWVSVGITGLVVAAMLADLSALRRRIEALAPDRAHQPTVRILTAVRRTG